MKIMSFLNPRIGRLLMVVVALTMPGLMAVAADKPETPAAAGDAIAMYAQAKSWDSFLANARVQRESWLKNAGRDVPPGLVDRFKRAGDSLQLLVITADWCPDSLHSVPYIATLAARAGVDLRVVDFRTGKAIMDAHKTPDGRASTPTVILLRGDQAVAAWVERPASLQWWYLGMAGQVSDEERLERKMAWYEWNRGTDALAEIVILAEQSAGKTASGSDSQ